MCRYQVSVCFDLTAIINHVYIQIMLSVQLGNNVYLVYVGVLVIWYWILGQEQFYE